MNSIGPLLIFAVELVVLAGVFLVLPRIGRRGLLFGVYVGEDRSGSDEARAITRGWYLRMGWTAIAAIALLLLLAFVWDKPNLFVLSTFTMIGGLFWAYLSAHYASRGLAVRSQPTAVAALDASPPSASWFPLLVTGLSIVVGFFLIYYAAARFDEMPERIPIHFNAAGEADGWADRSLIQLLVLPLMTLVLGGFLGLFAWLVAHAKRSLRKTSDPSSADAQQRFRLAISRFLCGITLLVTGLLGLISFLQIEVARGAAGSIGPLPLVLAFGVTVFSMGGAVYILARYGQGGAFMETASGDAALTDGLADNRYWKWGVFYVNREDPSFMVEKRFGLGYTINLGNPRAVAVFAAFLFALVALVTLALLTS